MKNHIIFEGAELSGKSWVMSQIYEYLEKKDNTNNNLLNGCHWFNCDNGIFGTKYGKEIIKNYLKIFEVLRKKNVIVEKFHISDAIYNNLYEKKHINYDKVEEKLIELDFSLVLIKFKKDKKLVEKRIKDRLNIYPHYKRILKEPEWYIKQQEEYQKAFERSKLKKTCIETDVLPDEKILEKLIKLLK